MPNYFFLNPSDSIPGGDPGDESWEVPMVRPDDQFICKLWKAANKDHTFFGFRFRALHIAELPYGSTPNLVQPLFAFNRSFPDSTKTIGAILFWFDAWSKSSAGANVVFHLRGNVKLPGELEGLLNWSGLEICLDSRCISGESRGDWGNIQWPALPAGDTRGTAFDGAFGLLLAPTNSGAWKHSNNPVIRNGRVELWHTRYAPNAGAKLSVRALDALDFWLNPNPTPITPIKGSSGPQPWMPIVQQTFPDNSSPNSDDSFYDLELLNSSVTDFNDRLTPWQRRQLVALTSQFVPGIFTPYEIETDRLILSPFGTTFAGGARFDIDLANQQLLPALTTAERLANPQIPQNWNGLGGFDLKSWYTETHLGRDERWSSVSVGFLFPFGQPIELSVNPHRTILNDDSSTPVACLIFEATLKIKSRTCEYDDPAPNQPFSRVAVKQQNLTFEFNSSSIDGTDLNKALQGDTPVILSFEATDFDGNVVEFTAPLVYFDSVPGQMQVTTGAAVYSARTDVSTIDLKGQKLTFAPSPDGHGTLETTVMSLGAKYNPAYYPASGQAPFVPLVTSATVSLDAVNRLTSQTQGDSITLQKRVTNNLFASLSQPRLVQAVTHTDRFGAMVAPNIKIQALSTATGAVAGSTNPLSLNGQLPSLSDFFGDSKLLGIVPLADALTTVTGKALPTFGSVRKGDAIDATFSFPGAPLQYDGLSVGNLEISIHARRPLDGSSPGTMNSTCTLTEVRLSLPSNSPLLIIGFNTFEFSVTTGSKPSIRADMTPPTFEGDLQFLNALLPFLTADSFSNPPTLDVDEQGAKLGYTLGIPSVPLGDFTLSNLTLSSLLDLPFTLDPMEVDFDFASAEKPFTVSVSGFAGVGHFGLHFQATELTRVDALLGFGGLFEIDVVVARGGVSLIGSVHLTYDSSHSWDVAGQVALSGYVEVLELVSISIEVAIALEYRDNAFTGTYEVTARVQIAFFSESVSFTLTKTFSGSAIGTQALHFSPSAAGTRRVLPPNSSPKFSDAVHPDEWARYCKAFGT
jgi:hypothetical protein